MKKSLLKSILAVSVFVSIVCGCTNDKHENDSQEALLKKVNEYVLSQMNTYYLWKDMMPDNVDFGKTPQRFFDRLIYSRDDKWSFITDDYSSLMDNREGKGKSYGYSVSLVKIEDSENYAAVVNYVYNGSVTQRNGIKRGDVFYQINGEPITPSNFKLLTDSDKVVVTRIKEQGVKDDITLVNEDLDIDPVLINKVIEHNGQKIGYFLLTQFQSGGEKKLDNQLQLMKAAGVKTMILDLRYNLGGNVKTAEHLCNSLAPLSVVNSSAIMLTKHWNKEMDQYLKDNKETYQLETRFEKSDVQLGLEKLYVITGKSTASASELTIMALKPHMPVAVVGEQTVGKYVAGLLLHPQIEQPDGTFLPDPEIGNWAIQSIIYKFANANGETDFRYGITPDKQASDNSMSEFELGDVQEPMLMATLEFISTKGGAKSNLLMGAKTKSYRVLKTATSSFDHYNSVAYDK